MGLSRGSSGLGIQMSFLCWPLVHVIYTEQQGCGAGWCVQYRGHQPHPQPNGQHCSTCEKYIMV